MELDKLVSQIREKKYKDKDSLIRDLNLLLTEIHNQLKSEIAKGKKSNKNVSEMENKLNQMITTLKKLRENKQNQTMRNIKFIMDKTGKEALELLKKLKQ